MVEVYCLASKLDFGGLMSRDAAVDVVSPEFAQAVRRLGGSSKLLTALGDFDFKDAESEREETRGELSAYQPAPETADDVKTGVAEASEMRASETRLAIAQARVASLIEGLPVQDRLS